jgi:alpha-glucosidase
MKKLILIISIIITQFTVQAQSEKRIEILSGEKWYGAAVNEGEKMPFEDGYVINLDGNTKGNQADPLILSTKGRYIWSNSPFAFAINKNEIVLSQFHDSILVENGGANLKEAYLKASERFFPPSGKLPDLMLFERPQYNTWIELIYDQNQADILKHARDIIDNGFPPGVLPFCIAVNRKIFDIEQSSSDCMKNLTVFPNPSFYRAFNKRCIKASY